MQHRHAARRGMREMFPQDDAEEEIEGIQRNILLHERAKDIQNHQKFHERSGKRPQVPEKRPAILQHEIGPAYGEDNAEVMSKSEVPRHRGSLNEVWINDQ